jgi:aromatic ring hydroxylase
MKKLKYPMLRTMLRDLESTGDAATPSNADAAFGEFTDEVHDYCNTEHAPAERLRTLRFTRAEISAAQKRFSAGAGEKCGCRYAA